MTSRGSAGPATNGDRRQRISSPPSASTQSDSTAGDRQSPADALFEASRGAYGDVRTILPEDELTGPERRDRGHRRADALIDNGWKDKANRAIDQLAAGRRPFSAEDVRDLVDDDAIGHAAWGSLLRVAAQHGRIRPAGYERASRPEAHSRVLTMWVGR
jgi:hypothetical protein